MVRLTCKGAGHKNDSRAPTNHFSLISIASQISNAIMTYIYIIYNTKTIST